MILKISKRGNVYLRTLLIHGGRAVVRCVGSKEDRKSKWVQSLIERRGASRTAVAVANKNARIVWALLTKGKRYDKAA